MFRLFVIALFFYVLAGCEATGPIFTEAMSPTGDKALIYIYRGRTDVFAAKDAYFYVDHLKVCELNSNGYSYFYGTPGVVEISHR